MTTGVLHAATCASTAASTFTFGFFACHFFAFFSASFPDTPFAFSYLFRSILPFFVTVRKGPAASGQRSFGATELRPLGPAQRFPRVLAPVFTLSGRRNPRVRGREAAEPVADFPLRGASCAPRHHHGIVLI